MIAQPLLTTKEWDIIHQMIDWVLSSDEETSINKGELEAIKVKIEECIII